MCGIEEKEMKTIMSCIAVIAGAMGIVANAVAAGNSSLGDSQEINASLLDGFRDCSVDLRYETESGRLISQTFQIPERKVTAQVRDGYASIRVQLNFHNLAVSQITVPTTEGAVYTQYAMQIDSPVTHVKEIFQKVWDVNFEEIGPDGMDDAVLVNYRMKTEGVRVSISGTTKTDKKTYMECSPMPTNYM